MKTLAELVTAFRNKELKLPALFDALGERGAVDASEHARDIAWLEQQRDEGGLDAQIVKALVTKLNSLQPLAPFAGPVHADDGDVTRVQASPPRPSAPADADATRVQAPVTQPVTQPGTIGGGDAPHAPTPVADDIDGTVVAPRAPSPTDDAATVVQPSSQPATTTGVTGNTGTTGATGTTSGLNTSSWQRVAEQTGGEFATAGMLLKGRFLLEHEIGRGGMGVVYLARDERKVEARDRDPYVAVKVLNDEFRRHPDSLIALQRESRRSQQLAHDNIVRVYDFDKDGTIVFMTMEYIDGMSLKTLIREQAYNGMPLAKARPLIEGMAWALKRAHAAGVVHSDFKPGNVMVTKDGVAKVFDFGIARAGKFKDDAKGEETVFDAGTLGALTPAYASLEMLRGGEPTPSDDLYALGCVTYELLTGKHPFDKVSAEVALKEGRTPPTVRGLTKRQNQTLRKAVAFHHDQRLQNAVELINGLRDVSLGERSRPFLIWGGITVVVLAAGGWGAKRYFDARHLAQVIDGFAVGNPAHYANEDAAYRALQGLGKDESQRVVVDNGAVIEAYLLARLDAYWNPAEKRFNYAGAQHVFEIRDKLKLFSTTLENKRQAIQQQRNSLLNGLDTQLSQRISAGAIFENQPDNVVATLDEIRAIDPNSELLENAQLPLKYDIAIGQSLAAGRIDEAASRVKLATRLFPKSQRLQQRAAQVASIESANAAAAKVTATEQSVPQARDALAKLIAKPALTPEWQAAVAGTLKVLQADHAPATQQLVDSLADAIAGQAALATQPVDVQRASSLVALGLGVAPKSAKLAEQRTRLDALQQQAQAKLEQESNAAEVTSRIESMKRAAAAHDIVKAKDSLDRIRALQPDNAFLAEQGPQLLASAYLGQADFLMGRGDYQRAADTLAAGLKAAGNRPELRNAQARDEFVADAMAARKSPPDAAGIRRLRNRLAALQKADGAGLQALEASLKTHRALPEGTLANLVDALKPASAAAPSAPAVTEAPSTSAPAEHPLPGTPRPGTSAPAASAHPTTPTAPAEATSDPCARPGLAGSGRACIDSAGGDVRGPSLVVIPGAGGGKPYAMSRTEITVGEFNRFCSESHQCAAKGGVANLPVTNISLAEAKAYAAWLTKATGYAYRLPTDAEWTHAAGAGQGWTQSPDSNCIPPSAGADGGSGGPVSSRGREPNPWGLVNMTGNVWEWVVSGGSVMVRGGSYNSYWSDCTVASHRSDGGNAQADVGFRVVRELR